MVSDKKTPQDLDRLEGILLVAPEHLGIPTRPYTKSKKNESQLGQLIRWVADLCQLNLQDFAQEAIISQQTLYRNCRTDSATLTGVMELTKAIRKFLGHEQFILFEAAWDLAGRSAKMPPAVWRGIAEDMAGVLKRAWDSNAAGGAA